MNIKEFMSSTTKKVDDNSFTSTYPDFERLLSTSSTSTKMNAANDENCN